MFRFANLQNLRRHLKLHLKRDSHLAEIDSEGEEKVLLPHIILNHSIITTVMISGTQPPMWKCMVINKEKHLHDNHTMTARRSGSKDC